MARKTYFHTKNKNIFWIMFCVLIIIGFIGYIGFSLHEDRRIHKLRLKVTSDHVFKPHVITSTKKTVNQKEIFSTNLSMIRTEEDLEKYNHGFKLHAFNQLVSDRIGFQSRPIPDTRPERCHSTSYELQAQTSVIICYYNEALSTVLRTISSVFKRTSPKLLKEIIVVDDGSATEMSKTIETFVDKFYLKEKLRFLRSEKQLGLIQARMFGARHATGDTLIFLDSHCEVNTGWIEPLLQELVNDTSKIVSPIIDTIHPDTFDYEPSELVRGGFNWGLHFSWEALPKQFQSQDPLKAFPTPTIAGGLFAVNRESFFHFGGYDEEMKEWGGENLEISFRTWMCGGSLAIAPCSRVGHVFRRRRPYGADNLAATRNALRVARVWLDEYKIHFIKLKPEVDKIDAGDVTERMNLRKKLKCKSFQWYLTKIYPELGIPGVRQSAVTYNSFKFRSSVVARGQISVSGLSICLAGANIKSATLQADLCSSKEKSQIWIVTDKGEIKLGDKLCLEGSSMTLRLVKCDGGNGPQNWRFLQTIKKEDAVMVGQLFNVAVGMCVSVNMVGDSYETAMRMCNKPSTQTFRVNMVEQ